jgi:AraC-like DNA-binding protein
MYPSKLALNTIDQSKYHHNVSTLTNHLSEKVIKVSEIEFYNNLAQNKLLRAPKQGLLFVFNLKDAIKCHSLSTGKEFHLGSFQSIMVTQKNAIELELQTNSNCHFCIITISELANLGNFKADFLHDNFQSQSSHHYWYTGIPNVKLSNFIYDLINLNTTFPENEHLLLGYTNIIIGSKLAEYHHFINDPKKLVDLRNDEIDRIHKCIQFVKDNYAQPIDVDMLCSKSSLSPQKLQTGFRELYGNTVTSYVKNFRLQIAEELMRTTELNVSQIVYSIGLTSRSYFSKIFKEKYESSPNDYIKKFKCKVA